MDIATGFRETLTYALSCLNFVVIPSRYFGNTHDITLWHLFVAFLGSTMLIKFFGFCMGGRFHGGLNDRGSMYTDFNDCYDSVEYNHSGFFRRRRG